MVSVTDAPGHCAETTAVLIGKSRIFISRQQRIAERTDNHNQQHKETDHLRVSSAHAEKAIFDGAIFTAALSGDDFFARAQFANAGGNNPVAGHKAEAMIAEEAVAGGNDNAQLRLHLRGDDKDGRFISAAAQRRSRYGVSRRA